MSGYVALTLLTPVDIVNQWWSAQESDVYFGYQKPQYKTLRHAVQMFWMTFIKMFLRAVQQFLAFFRGVGSLSMYSLLLLEVTSRKFYIGHLVYYIVLCVKGLVHRSRETKLDFPICPRTARSFWKTLKKFTNFQNMQFFSKLVRSPVVYDLFRD